MVSSILNNVLFSTLKKTPLQVVTINNVKVLIPNTKVLVLVHTILLKHLFRRTLTFTKNHLILLTGNGQIIIQMNTQTYLGQRHFSNHFFTVKCLHLVTHSHLMRVQYLT